MYNKNLSIQFQDGSYISKYTLLLWNFLQVTEFSWRVAFSPLPIGDTVLLQTGFGGNTEAYHLAHWDNFLKSIQSSCQQEVKEANFEFIQTVNRLDVVYEVSPKVFDGLYNDTPRMMCPRKVRHTVVVNLLDTPRHSKVFTTIQQCHGSGTFLPPRLTIFKNKYTIPNSHNTHYDRCLPYWLCGGY